MTDQPLALLLADELENPSYGWIITPKQCAAELRRLHDENEALQKALRRVIRTYMVADDAWDHDAELERLYQREVLK
jgi:hypothetical protein